MTTCLEDLKENPLWVYRVCNYSNDSSGLSSDKLLKKWKCHRHIRKVLKDKNITKFFPVQENAIPLLINTSYRDKYSLLSCDFIITAPTGQGKTLCYVLPLLNRILNLRENFLLSLIIVPSRELVKQIYDVFSWFVDSNPQSYDLNGSILKVRVFYGDKSLVKWHTNLLSDPPHIAILTPGVLVDYSMEFEERDLYFTFSHVKWIVLDEVDMMLNQSFFEWADVVVDMVNRLKTLDNNHHEGYPQKILVSATVPLKSYEIEVLELNRPILLRPDEIIYKIPETLTQNYILASKRSRPLVLLKVLKYLCHKKDPINVLVFFSKIETCHKISRFVQIYFYKENMNLKAFEFSSKLSQKHRNRIMKTYKNETGICLLCSDVASRGIDFSNTSVVISYDFPKKLSTYIHRAGRTARGNKKGSFYVFVSEKDEKDFNKFMNKLKIEKDVINKVEVDSILSEKKSKKIQEMYPKLVEMNEKCLELEYSGKIKYHSDMETCFGSPTS